VLNFSQLSFPRHLVKKPKRFIVLFTIILYKSIHFRYVKIKRELISYSPTIIKLILPLILYATIVKYFSNKLLALTFFTRRAAVTL